ncbi:MAG TPA: antibiotic biosynthesis monooxygenase [Micrococcaceae bacterium]|jgi:quinol monooxygenase YgiN|nr:antibiotic biosynthesis monooxygenase [Micrococcaceae bacterium]
MSVIVAVKVAGDTSAFRKSLEERAEEYRKIAERSREKGALHHRVAMGDGYILINDEWESAEAFKKFFADPELQAFIGSVGADTSAAPEIIIGESVDSPDKF